MHVHICGSTGLSITLNHFKLWEHLPNSDYPSIHAMKLANQIYVKCQTSMVSIFRLCVEVLKQSFSDIYTNYICNKMLFWGVFPNRFKYAIAIPLFKKGDREYVKL
jgi:hypothetical protein